MFQNPNLTLYARVPGISSLVPLPPKDSSLDCSYQAPNPATSGSGAPSLLFLGTWALLPGDTWDIHIQLPWELPPHACPHQNLLPCPLNATCLLLNTSDSARWAGLRASPFCVCPAAPRPREVGLITVHASVSFPAKQDLSCALTGRQDTQL